MSLMTSFTPVQSEGTVTHSVWDFSGDEVLLASGWHLAGEEAIVGSVCESVDDMEEVSAGTTVVLLRDVELLAAEEEWLPLDIG